MTSREPSVITVCQPRECLIASAGVKGLIILFPDNLHSMLGVQARTIAKVLNWSREVVIGLEDLMLSGLGAGSYYCVRRTNHVGP